jgi:hypothetical protein
LAELKVGWFVAETFPMPRQKIEKTPRNLKELLPVQTVNAVEVGKARNAGGRGKVSVPFPRLQRRIGVPQQWHDPLKLVAAELIDRGSIVGAEPRFELTAKVPPLVAEGGDEHWVVGGVARERLIHRADVDVQSVKVVEGNRKCLDSD